MSLVKKFETQTARVKGACFHPTRPWIITSLHSGAIQIWDYNMKIIIATFEQSQGPIRGVDFHPHLPLFVSGSDSGNVRVWNYKQKRCIFVLKGHIDYVRTTYFHNQLPWILSASDDQTMRIWNYQSRNCVNIITGHSHYVMCAQFHPQKNYIVSASLDSTVRIWDYSILRKKLTQSKGPAGFIGIQIQCIKILEGHQRGCNWACFHPTSNIIASGSDDRKVKLWKYTNQVAWEHSTILGHKNNVSCLLFDPVTQNLISNSQDKSLRIWNTESKTQILIEKKPKARYWILATRKNGTLLASGHDQGLDMFQLNKQRVPHAMIATSTIVVFAQGFTSYLYDVKQKKQKMELYQYKPKDKNSISYIDRIITNPYNNSVFIVQIKQSGQNQRSYMVKKKQSYLNFPSVSKEYQAMDSCFANQKIIAVIKTPLQLQLIDITQISNECKAFNFKEPFSMKRVFHSNTKNQIILVTAHNNRVNKFDIQKRKFIGALQVEDTDINSVVYGPEKLAILFKMSIIIVNENFEKIATIKQKFPIKSIFWEGPKLLFYTTINHLKYAFMNGQTGVLKTIDEPIHLLQKLQGNKFLAFNQKQKVYQIQFPDYIEIQFKMAINDRKIDKIKSILSKVGGSKKKILIKHLVQKGYADLGLSLVTDPQQKFSLAIQSSNFQLALELCNKINTQQYWKMLGEQALKQGIFEGYEASCQKLKNFDQLNFLYSLQNNTDKLQKMLKIGKKTNNPILSFNTNLYLGNGQVYEQILRDAGLQALAQLSRQAYSQQGQKSELLKRLKSRPLTPVQAVGQQNSSNWPHNIEQQQEDEENN